MSAVRRSHKKVSLPEHLQVPQPTSSNCSHTIVLNPLPLSFGYGFGPSSLTGFVTPLEYDIPASVLHVQKDPYPLTLLMPHQTHPFKTSRVWLVSKDHRKRAKSVERKTKVLKRSRAFCLESSILKCLYIPPLVDEFFKAGTRPLSFILTP